MRPGFIAIVPRLGDHHDFGAAMARLRSFGLRQVEIGNATLFVQGDVFFPFAGTEGACVGMMFDRRDNGAVESLRSSQCLAIESSDGRFLADAFWGSFVAFWRDRRTRALSLYRDPSGGLPMFHSRSPGCDIVFSDLELGLATGLVAPRVDWAGIAHSLRFRQLPAERTGLENVSEILPGQGVVLDEPAPQRMLLWSPWTYAPRAGATAVADPSALADVITGTIAAWSSRFGALQLELSGGLDSSIIAHGLAARSEPWRCVSIYTPGTDGDERPYARLMAAAASAPIDEVAVEAEDFRLTDEPGRLRPRPGGFGVLGAIDRASVAAATASGTSIIFSGTGGDNVFCYILSATPVLDAYRTAGAAQARETIADIAQLSGTTSWTVARHAVQRMVSDVLYPQSWAATAEFLGPTARPDLEPHPWLDRPGNALPGSRTHIASILRIMPMIDASDRAVRPGLIFPLMSQPIIEACLAIPSWQWTQGGRDRAAVRHAFAGRLPSEITARRSKGRLESAILPAFERSRDELKALLVSGFLARAEIIDVKAVDQALRRPVSADDFAYTRILELVDAELWASSINAINGTGAPRG